MSNPSPQQTYNQYVVRNFSSNDHYGITVTKKIAEKIKGIKFTVDLISSNEPITLEPGTYLRFKSGLDLVQLKREIDNYDIDDYQ